MASMPVRNLRALAPTTTREGDERPDDESARRAHRERVRASLAWALEAYAPTLAKLAK